MAIEYIAKFNSLGEKNVQYNYRFWISAFF